jgi:hypothetical protein
MTFRLFDALFGPRRPAPVTVVRRQGNLAEDWQALQSDGQRLFADQTIAERIEERRADKDFQKRLRTAVERNKEALDLLAK